VAPLNLPELQPFEATLTASDSRDDRILHTQELIEALEEINKTFHFDIRYPNDPSVLNQRDIFLLYHGIKDGVVSEKTNRFAMTGRKDDLLHTIEEVEKGISCLTANNEYAFQIGDLNLPAVNVRLSIQDISLPENIQDVKKMLENADPESQMSLELNCGQIVHYFDDFTKTEGKDK
jgi:hypothetical protein